MELTDFQKNKIIKPLAFFLFVISLFFVVRIVNELRIGRTIGADAPAQSVISVSGEGEVTAIPDLATFSATVRNEGETPDAAQEVVTEKMNEVLAYLEEQGVEEKDVKTTSYNLYPRYEYRAVEALSFPGVPGDRERVLVGYEVTHSVQVKVRDTDKAGDLLAGVGNIGVDSISGISFTIDDEEELQREARQKAIDDAKEKAKELAGDLEVRLVRIIGFNEFGGGSYPRFDYAMAETAAFDDGAFKASPEIPTGENTIRSSVSITYEIR